MNLESIREYCLSLPHATEMVQWEDHLLFKIGGKMFAIVSLEPQDVVLSFKATPEGFFECQEQEGVIPAPYMARNQWLALERWDALRDDELRDLLATSYRLVFEKLPKRTQLELQSRKKSKGKAQVKKKAARTTTKVANKKVSKKKN
jgi:predicted DNA-binding protein (MmcQ/YjbR family)